MGQLLPKLMSTHPRYSLMTKRMEGCNNNNLQDETNEDTYLINLSLRTLKHNNKISMSTEKILLLLSQLSGNKNNN